MKNSNKFLMIPKIILVILTLIYPVFMDILSGAGFVYNSDSYGARLTMFGWLMISGGVLMTIGTVLCLLKKNVISIIFSIAGFVLCMTILYNIIQHADSHGWMDHYNLNPISDMYKVRVLPTIAPFVMTVIISGIQFFSYECAEKRREKKRRKFEKENAPVPSVVD